MKTNRNICVVTGTRAEYGLLKPIMQRIENDNSLSLQVIVTGSHLLEDYGYTIETIFRDGFNVDAKIPIVFSGNDKENLPHSIGHGIICFSQSFDILDSDIILVLGDRYEILPASIAASYGRRILAHIHGGDKLRAGFDEYTRHAITKIAHLHFAATEKSSQRILQLGESPERVVISGSPAIETINSIRYLPKKEIINKLNLDDKLPVCLLIYHPISTNPDKSSDEIKLILDILLEYNHQIVSIYPNVDPGNEKIIKLLEYYKRKNSDKIKLFKNLIQSDYFNIMNISDFMIGNSSSGIVESSSFKLPVVNIGNRQQGRESAENVLHVNCSRNDIKKGIDKCLYDSKFKKIVSNCISPYGEGETSKIICNTLKSLIISEDLFAKSINYD